MVPFSPRTLPPSLGKVIVLGRRVCQRWLGCACKQPARGRLGRLEMPNPQFLTVFWGHLGGPFLLYPNLVFAGLLLEAGRTRPDQGVSLFFSCPNSSPFLAVSPGESGEPIMPGQLFAGAAAAIEIGRLATLFRLAHWVV